MKNLLPDRFSLAFVKPVRFALRRTGVLRAAVAIRPRAGGSGQSRRVGTVAHKQQVKREREGRANLHRPARIAGELSVSDADKSTGLHEPRRRDAWRQ